MKTTGNTILITGGTSGIGLELASRFLALGNRVIVTGRDPAKLAAASHRHPGLHVLESDASDPAAIVRLRRQVLDEHPDLNMLVNNAGIMRKINLHQAGADLEDLTREIEVNLNGAIRMATHFLPHLKTRGSAAIVNVSSGLAFLPAPVSPVYCAAKAAIHSFTQSLRMQLAGTRVKVFELAPPLTDTPLATAAFDPEEFKGLPLMSTATLASRTLAAIEKDRYEIRPGLSNVLKLMSRIAPGWALRRLGGPSVERLLAQAQG